MEAKIVQGLLQPLFFYTFSVKLIKGIEMFQPCTPGEYVYLVGYDDNLSLINGLPNPTLREFCELTSVQEGRFDVKICILK